MLGDTGQSRRDNDASGLFIVQRDGLLVLERGRCPVVQRHVKLFAALARGFNDLLIGERLVLVERQTACNVGCCVEPFVAITLLGVLLQVGRLHDLCLRTDCAADGKDGGEHPETYSFHSCYVMFFAIRWQKYKFLFTYAPPPTDVFLSFNSFLPIAVVLQVLDLVDDFLILPLCLEVYTEADDGSNRTTNDGADDHCQSSVAIFLVELIAQPS